MQTVKYISDITPTVGSLGYSVLQGQYDGAVKSLTVKRMTCLYLRDNTGWPVTVVIVPADAVRGAF